MLPKILLVENDPQFAYLMRRYADNSGCQLICIGFDDDGLAAARREQPALIILDAMLPGLSSDRFLRALKSDPATRRIPVIVYSSLETALSGWEEEADVRLVKPVGYAEFLAALEATGVKHQPAERGVQP
jgi:twitching motility two-component system response regulator PilH